MTEHRPSPDVTVTSVLNRLQRVIQAAQAVDAGHDIRAAGRAAQGNLGGDGGQSEDG